MEQLIIRTWLKLTEKDCEGVIMVICSNETEVRQKLFLNRFSLDDLSLIFRTIKMSRDFMRELIMYIEDDVRFNFELRIVGYLNERIKHFNKKEIWNYNLYLEEREMNQDAICEEQWKHIVIKYRILLKEK